MFETVICKHCKELGGKSTVRMTNIETTGRAPAVSYNEEGERIIADENVTTAMFLCSMGHTFELSETAEEG